MAEWGRVKWTEARQVHAILSPDEELPEEEAKMSPSAYFDHLRAAGREVEAVHFLAQALPRLEVVGWAARTVRDLPSPQGDRNGTATRALRGALLWLGDPTESRRRSAFEAAEACKPSGSAEALAAKAVFFSGGSIAPSDLTPVPAPRDAAGRFASAAVIVACCRQTNMKEAFKVALDSGAQIAIEGLETADA